ncbi:MAG TPA: hypothetical protein VG672_02850, partial [Bryobacteraceae bacterium]|nr:hypothetical protein [Bryobacteraceae bacterium]
MRLWAQAGHGTAQLLDTAGVATIPDHLIDARGAQAWMLLQHLAHKRQIGVDNGRPERLGVLEAFHFNGAPHGVGVDASMISPETRVQIRRYFYAEHWKIGTIAQALNVHPDT